MNFHLLQSSPSNPKLNVSHIKNTRRRKQNWQVTDLRYICKCICGHLAWYYVTIPTEYTAYWTFVQPTNKSSINNLISRSLTYIIDTTCLTLSILQQIIQNVPWTLANHQTTHHCGVPEWICVFIMNWFKESLIKTSLINKPHTSILFLLLPNYLYMPEILRIVW